MVLEKDTIAYQMTRPLVAKRDISKIELASITKVMKPFVDQLQTKATPEEHAVNFYMLNHAFAQIRLQVLPEEPLKQEFMKIIDLYFKNNTEYAKYMFFYLLLICTRESRHCKNKEEQKERIVKDYGITIWDFFNTPPMESDMAAQKLLDKPLYAGIGKYTEHMVAVFNTGQYTSSYGGKAWGEVAECLHRYVIGEYSMEAMVDTAFTLCHNNGPIFNKGMLFKCYEKTQIETILDIQRSGQIPQLIKDSRVGNYYIGQMFSTSHQLHETIEPILRNEFSDSICWQKVEDLGALKTYPGHKTKQKEYHPEKKPITTYSKTSKGDIEWMWLTPKDKIQKINRKQVNQMLNKSTILGTAAPVFDFGEMVA